MNRLSKRLADKWRRRKQSPAFVRIRFAISLVRAKNWSIRGSKIPTERLSHSVDWEGGSRLVFSYRFGYVGFGAEWSNIIFKFIRRHL